MQGHCSIADLKTKPIFYALLFFMLIPLASCSGENTPKGNGSIGTTGNLKTARVFHTATLFTNAKVLITGGASIYSPLSDLLNSADLYNPV